MAVDASAVEGGLRDMGADLHGRLVDGFMDRARQNASRREGTMADSVEEVARADTATSFSSTVECTSEHGRYQEEGTGIYGPEGAPITGSPLLAFDWPAAGGLVIVHSVRGSPATHWWSRTTDAWPDIVGAVA